MYDLLTLPSQYGAKKLMPLVMNARTRQNEPSTNSLCTAIVRRRFPPDTRCYVKASTTNDQLVIRSAKVGLSFSRIHH